MRLPTLIGLGVGLGLWALLAERAGPLLLPTPWAVVVSLVEDRARLAEATWHTARGALGGLGLAVVLGVGGAVASWWSRALREALLPWVVLLQILPIVAVAPLLVVWLGYGVPVAVATGFIAAFYPVFSATSTGLVAPGPELVDLLRLYRAPRWRELWDLRLPSALPALFSGLRTAGGLAVIGAIVGEFVGSNGLPPALGQVVMYAARQSDMALCFAAIACAAGLALIVHAGIRALEARAIGRWYGS